MPEASSGPAQFIISAYDPQLCCSVLEARFIVPDLRELRKLLKLPPDANFKSQYYKLERAEYAEVIDLFNIPFDPSQVTAAEPSVSIAMDKENGLSQLPYLVHTGYELFLLLDGRKKLAKMYGSYPPDKFEGEESFDHWVEKGYLSRKEIVDPFEKPIKKWLGNRSVYYTLKGEEWRTPAMELIWKASAKAGGWNEYFERLEGMLFGYEDWQNDLWIERLLSRGGVGGSPLCCAVNAAGLKWIESAGYRALPPSDKPTLTIATYDDWDEAKMRSFLFEESDSVALVRFVVPLWKARDLLPPSKHGERWTLSSDRIPDLNRQLRNAVVVAITREEEPPDLVK